MPPAFSGNRVKSDDPQVVSMGSLTCLRFSTTAVQSAMCADTPLDLMLGYTRSMMGFMLFNSAPAQIGMIGLGGGSLAKYCRHHLPASRFVAVESNAKVIALRDRFAIPPDDALFQVVLANGEDWVREASSPVDVLLLDGYSAAGIPIELSQQGFYDNCYAKLSDRGLVVANFSTTDPKSGIYAQRLRASFDGQAASIEAADLGNRIMFAWKGAGFDALEKSLMQHVNSVRRTHGIDLEDVAKRLQQRLQQQRRIAGEGGGESAGAGAQSIGRAATGLRGRRSAG
jgi:spermidine synthase